jgi:hypothetical protein
MSERKPTRYEQETMETLGFKSLRELEEFLNLPSWGCPDMQVPENEEEQAEDQWQEGQAT